MYVFLCSILFYLLCSLENSIPKVKCHTEFYSIISEMVTHVGSLHGLEPFSTTYAFRHDIFKVERKVSPVV